jgi:hypothetical protein
MLDANTARALQRDLTEQFRALFGRDLPHTPGTVAGALADAGTIPVL